MSNSPVTIKFSGITDKLKEKKIPLWKEVPTEEQSWKVEPDLPDGLDLDIENRQIKGTIKKPYSELHKLTISGNGKQKKYDLIIKIMEGLPFNAAKLVLDAAGDGTSLGHGCSEFIDNSIDADAKNIDIKISYETFEAEGVDSTVFRPWMIIEDDGGGIIDPDSNEVGVAAIKQAIGWASSPTKNYEKWRLGAFGVGLPAAALSSARFCTVFTKKDNKIVIGHMSLDDIKDTKSLRFFEEKDINEYLKNCNSYKLARKSIDNKQHGTIVLLQDHYQIRTAIKDFIGDSKEQEFKKKLNLIKHRLRDYLSLVYHHFLDNNGVKLKDSDGKDVKRKIRIKLSGGINPLDPLMRHRDSKKGTGKKGSHIITHTDSVCRINNMESYYEVTMSVLPGLKNNSGYGRETPDGSSYDEKMANAWMVYKSQEGADAQPTPKELQGLYLYRNYRLIEFATWQGIKKINAGHQVCRAAIYTPLGLPKKDPSADVHNDFSVDSRKRYMHCTQNIKADIGRIIEITRLWHNSDPKKHSFTARATNRDKYDGKSGKNKKSSKTKLKEAVIEPSVIEEKEIPAAYVLKDSTPKIHQDATREWTLNGQKIGSGKNCSFVIDETGRHDIILTIKHKNTKYQISKSIKCIEKDNKEGNTETKENQDSLIPNYWDVQAKEFGENKPPIILEGNTYYLNADSPKLKGILKIIQVLHKDGDLI